MKARFARAMLCCLLPVACCLTSACGYSSKSLYSRSYHTVSVPIFTNKTFRRELEFRLTEAIDKNLESRTPYKIAAQKEADTILTGEIVDTHGTEETVLTERFRTDIPRESQFTLVINYTWKDARTGRILRSGTITRSATEIPQIGERIADAQQLATERAAAAIVDQLQSDW